jgi:hypothetical protein
MKTILFLALVLFLLFPLTGSAQDNRLSEVDLQGCINLLMLRADVLVISDEATLQGAVRKDASHPRCIEVMNGLGLDLTKETLVGSELITGYCTRPAGLIARAFRDEAAGLLEIRIEYLDLKGITCKALGRYDLWLRVPRPSPGVEISVKVVRVEAGEDKDQPIWLK